MKPHSLSAARRSVLIACLAFSLPAFAAPAPTWIYFDNLADGTRVDGQYAEQGVRFVNDYVSGHIYRSSPQITAYALARSAPNVLVNRAYDDEINSSANTPMVLRFGAPISGVGLQLGCVGSCGTVTGAVVRLFDCQGQLRAQGLAVPRPDFSAPIQVLDSSGQTHLVVIDYGSSIVPEAIDDLAVQFSDKTCVDSVPPVVEITSHQDQQVVASPTVVLRGRVRDNSGFVAQLKINGASVPVTPRAQADQPPVYEFSWPLTLQPGANPIAAVAWDGGGLKGSVSMTLHYGAPATVQVAEFHLTQRGIMQSNACDIDTPLVAGKSTIVRVRLDARTAGGQATYVEGVKMAVSRRVGAAELPVATLDGTTFSPYVSQFGSAGDLAGVHFWIPGDVVDAPGDYIMRFLPYVGASAVGTWLEAPCPSHTLTFAETKPIRLLVLPLEQPFYASDVPDVNRQALYAQLDQLARTYPVRDGASATHESANTGIKYAIAAPHVLSDGTFTNRFYPGTGPAWRFKDAHPQGLARSDHTPVADPAVTQCPPNSIIGGRLASTNLILLPRRTPYGFFTPGAPAQWRDEGKKYAHPLDENHDGVIDLADLSIYVAEYLGTNPTQWQTDLTRFQPGDIFRTFHDTNGNHCHDGDEPVAPIAQRWLNAGKHVLWAPSGQARNDYNQWNSVPVDYASLYLAPDFHPMVPGYHFFGPGQGNEPGELTWISPGLDTNWQASNNVLCHELGHNFGFAHENVPIPAWQTYIHHERVNANAIVSLMDPFVLPPNRSFLRNAHYLAAFQHLAITSAASRPATLAVKTPAAQTEALVVSGTIGPDQQLAYLDVVATTASEFTEPDPTSPWRLRVGFPNNMVEHAFPIRWGDAHPETVMVPIGSFQATVPMPEGTRWIEIRRGRTLVTRRERSAHAPQVQVVRPGAGQTFGPEGNTVVAWTARDDDGDGLTFSIQYSPNGETWLPLAAGLTSSPWTWNLAGVPGGSEARIRVVASDGFNQGTAESEGVFRVNGKPPHVAILEPRAGARFLQGQAVFLRAFATDPEGGPVSIGWYVDTQTVATNRTASIPAPAPGPHLITLAGRDAQGLLAVAMVNVVVEADSDRDGMSDAFEERYGLDVSRAADALEDTDGDGLNNFEEAWRGLNPRDRDSDQDGMADGDEVMAGLDPADAGSRPPCMPPPPGLSHWWPANGDAEDVAGDSPGQIESGTRFAPGKSGQAFAFDRVGGVVMGDAPSLSPGQFTVTAWIFPTSYDGNRVLEKGGWRIGGGYGFEFNPFGSLGIRFVVWADGPTPIDSDAAVPLHVWTHLAGTFDGATMRLFVNGLEQGGSRAAILQANTAPLTIGRASGGHDLFFQGLIDDVQLYPRALTADEIGTLAGAGSGGLCPGCAPGPPRLQIARLPGTVTLSWPLCPDWVLEAAPVLEAGHTPWLPVSRPELKTNSQRVELSLPVSEARQFYRLHQP